jgi:hypothetical protein
MKYRMLRKNEWIYHSRGDEFRGFYEKWVPTLNGDKEERVTNADVGFYRRPIREPKRRAKVIAVDGHRERVKPAKMPMPKGCNECPMENICKMVGWSSKQCKRALRKAWAWARGVKG